MVGGPVAGSILSSPEEWGYRWMLRIISTISTPSAAFIQFVDPSTASLLNWIDSILEQDPKDLRTVIRSFRSFQSHTLIFHSSSHSSTMLPILWWFSGFFEDFLDPPGSSFLLSTSFQDSFLSLSLYLSLSLSLSLFIDLSIYLSICLSNLHL